MRASLAQVEQAVAAGRAARGRASVEVPEGVMDRVTIKLDDVPWDQAFDLLVRLNGLTWTRAGDVLRLEVRRRAPSR